MILVVGGISSGKRSYVKEVLGYNDNQIADGIIDNKPVLYNLQDIIRNDNNSETNKQSLEELRDLLLDKEVIICNEVGAGIIPVDGKERAWREQTGRICILLAKDATKVIRFTCGIPQVIKE